MRKVLLSLSVAALMFSCADKKTNEKESDGGSGAYTITGIFDEKMGMEAGSKVYLFESIKDNIITDSANIVQGKFEMKGTVAKPAVRQMAIRNGSRPQPVIVAFVLEAGNIKISMGEKLAILGTTLNDKMQVHNDALAKKYKELGDIHAGAEGLSQDDPKMKELQSKTKTKWDEIKNSNLAFVKENINNPLGAYYFLTNQSLLSQDETKEILEMFSESEKSDNEALVAISERTAAIEATSIGKKFTDVKGLTIDGQETSLSDYAGKGKIVLVDFWASWCGPCIKELPYVKEAYAKYKNKGFEIVGVSLDESKEAWQGATEKHKIGWPQFSNLQAWNEPAAKAYGVSSIPHTVLLDKEGIIIAKNLRGEALSEKLEELLK